jgi:single-stranded-DNA-specific exonuclease
MDECNERRKRIQKAIVEEARRAALAHGDAPILFLGGDWHQGVVGIAASKIAEEFWRPVWLFQRKDGLCKGSARSIPGFDVTAAMSAAKDGFVKFGGHRAAGGFTFRADQEAWIRGRLTEHAQTLRATTPSLWDSRIDYDCALSADLASLALTDELDALKPFGHGFEEPKFRISAEIARLDFFKDKNTGEPRHTCVMIKGARGVPQKIMFFNGVHQELVGQQRADFVVSVSRNTFRGQTSLMMMGHDFQV